VAAATAIEQAVGVQALLKWPNDVLVGGRKVAGILVEGLSGELFYVVGLGVNMGAPSLPAELREHASSLDEVSAAGVDASEVLATFLDHLERAIDGMTADAGERVRSTWEARMAGRGAIVSVRSAHGTGPALEGVALGIADDGALRMRTAVGEQLVYAGDVTLRGAPVGGT
jgi:BirA family biotin operon repressor/biotin-[acetyl-CoA-carboxylase] ligase